MNRSLLKNIPSDLPLNLAELVKNVKIYDSSCSPEARVYFIEKQDGFYLKTAAKGTLKREAEMTEYFHSKGFGTEVLQYISEDADWLLTAKAQGEDCTHQMYLDDPKRLCDVLAEALRKLHETDFSDCPVQNRLEEYFALAEHNYRTGNYDKSHFPDSFGYRSAEEAYAVMSEGKSALKSDVLIHGDYCLPNVMLENWKFSKFIDVGNGGVADRHIDLFWGAWTLWFNLHTDKYRDRFLDAYGRDRVDEEILKIVAAAEVFG